MKNVSNSYENEILQLRKEYIQLQKDLKTKNIACSTLQEDIDHKQDLIHKHEFDMQKQMETVAHMNNEVWKQKRLEAIYTMKFKIRVIAAYGYIVINNHIA